MTVHVIMALIYLLGTEPSPEREISDPLTTKVARAKILDILMQFPLPPVQKSDPGPTSKTSTPSSNVVETSLSRGASLLRRLTGKKTRGETEADPEADKAAQG